MTKISVRQAQADLPDLIGRALRGKEPCFIQQQGKTVAVLVSPRVWQARQRRLSQETNGDQESRLRAYEAKLSGKVDYRQMHDLMISFGSPAPKYVKELMGL